MSLPLHALSIAEAGALIRQRRLSPVEYTDHLIARIETFDAQLHAFITPPSNGRAAGPATRRRN